MFTILLAAAFLWVLWKLLVVGVKIAWGFARILVAVLAVPLFLVGVLCVGFAYAAAALLLIAGVFLLLYMLTERQ